MDKKFFNVLVFQIHVLLYEMTYFYVINLPWLKWNGLKGGKWSNEVHQNWKLQEYLDK